MANPLRYIKDLEAVGVPRAQAEIQVQIVMDVMENELLTKSEFALFKEQIDHRFIQMRQFIKESQMELLIKLSAVLVTVVSIAGGALAWFMSWLIKVH